MQTSGYRVRVGACGALLLFLAGVALAAPVLDISRTEVGFVVAPGRDAIHWQSVTLTNVGTDRLRIGFVALRGAGRDNYGLEGTCRDGETTLVPGQRCTLVVGFSQNAPSADALLEINTDIPGGPFNVGLASAYANAIGTGLYAFATFATPYFDVGEQPVGTTSAGRIIGFASDGVGLPLTITDLRLVGRHPGDFTVTSGCPVGVAIPVGGGCAFSVTFTPTATGPRAAEIQLTAQGVPAPFTVALTGVGGTSFPPGMGAVVEYYNAVLDHYFITWTSEQDYLDAGRTPTRWTRTGHSFSTYTVAQADTSPVCRFYIPPDKGDSHFFGRGEVECDATRQKNPSFLLEDPKFMHLILPKEGTCPADTIPIYRVFSNRADANHRYMTDRAVRDRMITQGWLAEGDGPDLVVMCAP